MTTGLHESRTHKLARRVVRPLIGTAVTPNHLTTLRLITGLAACAAFAVGGRAREIWGGVLHPASASCSGGRRTGRALRPTPLSGLR